MIILASASPRRRQLLRRLVKSFRVIPSRVDERKITAANPPRLAEKTARAKCAEVAARYPKAVVIGADTIVVLGRTILGKPGSPKEAISMLTRLAGRTHRVITGLAVYNPATGKTTSTRDITYVKMKKVAKTNILAYVKSGRPLDKAGGYGIQEIEEIFIESIKGDYDNVVGLPLLALKKLLKPILK